MKNNKLMLNKNGDLKNRCICDKILRCNKVRRINKMIVTERANLEKNKLISIAKMLK
jgi:hypothetical protein